jgi:hypothetical protein
VITTSALAAARGTPLRGLRIVAHHTHVQHLAIEPREHAVQRVAVRVVDLAFPQRGADGLQLVAGGEESDAKLPVHRDLADAQRRDESQLRGPDDASLPERDRSLLQVLAASRTFCPVLFEPPKAMDLPLAFARSCMTTVSAPQARPRPS